MRVPELSVAASPLGSEFVRFATSEVAGTAFRESGCGETHYDILDVQPASADGRSAMREIAPDSCSFDVVGRVVDQFDDGVCVVEACGFDFWIDPEDVPAGCGKGSRLRFVAANFTLYI